MNISNKPTIQHIIVLNLQPHESDFGGFLIPLRLVKGWHAKRDGVVGKMKRYILLFLILFIPQIAHADDVADADMQRAMQISKLKREISELEIQLSECQRKNKNWKTATWIGAAGTVATGTAAIVQGVKLNNLKKEKAKPTEGAKDEK